jgi:hypothetical protein
VREPDENLIEIETELPERELSQELLEEDVAFRRDKD